MSEVEFKDLWLNRESTMTEEVFKTAPPEIEGTPKVWTSPALARVSDELAGLINVAESGNRVETAIVRDRFFEWLASGITEMIEGREAIVALKVRIGDLERLVDQQRSKITAQQTAIAGLKVAKRKAAGR